MNDNALYAFGLVGLGVMGQNLLLNVADHNFSAIGLDTNPEQAQAIIDQANGRKLTATTSVADFVARLQTPRCIMLLVPAGKVVDIVIADLLPHLDKGDLIVDGGNSFYADTDRRYLELKEKGIAYMGAGVSGGAKGARTGPSIMPGGTREAYKNIKPIFEAIAANAPDGSPCVKFLGNGSAGNYVKMVHNGIEYAMMELLAEAYDMLKRVGGYSAEQLHQTFKKWNEGRLQSFLVEITASIFAQEDDRNPGRPLVDAILDKAKQKGTGKWTSQNAMDLGIPVPTIDAAVTMRGLSGLKQLRQTAENHYAAPEPTAPKPTHAELEEQLEQALYFSFIISYAQGLHQLAEASEEYKYELNLHDIASIWRGGCIIRAGLLEDIRKAFSGTEQPEHLLLAKDLVPQVEASVGGARQLVQWGAQQGIPLLGFGAALAYFESFRTGRLPSNLIQAQRDHFGQHSYERTDAEGVFRTEWL
jgi:6-phosphogluconate dehydrogenase